MSLVRLFLTARSQMISSRTAAISASSGVKYRRLSMLLRGVDSTGHFPEAKTLSEGFLGVVATCA